MQAASYSAVLCCLMVGYAVVWHVDMFEEHIVFAIIADILAALLCQACILHSVWNS